MIVLIVSKLDTDRGLTPIFVLALALLVFSFAGAVGGSGFLAVYVAGIYAGNRKMQAIGTIKRFQDGMPPPSPTRRLAQPAPSRPSTARMPQRRATAPPSNLPMRRPAPPSARAHC